MERSDGNKTDDLWEEKHVMGYRRNDMLGKCGPRIDLEIQK